MACAVSTDLLACAETNFDADARWCLHDQVEIRPERFGALLYHFGTRRLSFIKSRQLLSVLEALEGSLNAEHALTQAGVTEADRPTYVRALETLAGSHMICLAS